MVRYFKLNMDMSRKNDVICHYENDFGIQQNTFILGKKYNDWDNRFQFYYDKEEGEVLTDYLANDKGWFVVSKKLKQLMKTMNTEIQYIPVKVIEKSSLMDITYYIANILKLMDALCLEKSEYFETEIPSIGTIYTVSKYAVYENRIENSDVFKLSNRQEVPIFVSDRFKTTIEINNITGISFTEIRVVQNSKMSRGIMNYQNFIKVYNTKSLNWN